MMGNFRRSDCTTIFVPNKSFGVLFNYRLKCRFDQCNLDWTNRCKNHLPAMFQTVGKCFWLPMAGGSYTDWSKLRHTGRNYDFAGRCYQDLTVGVVEVF